MYSQKKNASKWFLMNWLLQVFNGETSDYWRRFQTRHSLKLSSRGLKEVEEEEGGWNTFSHDKGQMKAAFAMLYDHDIMTSWPGNKQKNKRKQFKKQNKT